MAFVIQRGPRPADNFAIISNSFLRDARLSAEARGVGAYLLTHDASFKLTIGRIGTAMNMGRDKTGRVIKELEDAGYLCRKQGRDDAGKLGSITYHMTDVSAGGDQDTENPATADQCLVNRATDEPSPAAPVNGSDGTIKKTNSKKTNQAEDEPKDAAASDGAEGEPEFSAKDVVAAYVDSFRLKSGGQDPVGRFIGQVGREAKKLIAEGRSSELLLRAATELGRTPYASLENQVTRLMTNVPAGVQTGKAEAYQPGLESRRNEENWRRLYAENPERFSVPDMGLDDDGPAF